MVFDGSTSTTTRFDIKDCVNHTICIYYIFISPLVFYFIFLVGFEEVTDSSNSSFPYSNWSKVEFL